MQLLMEMSKKDKAKDRQLQQRGGMTMVQPMQGYNQMGQYQQMGGQYQQWGQMNTMQMGGMQQANSLANWNKRDQMQDTDANAPWAKKKRTEANAAANVSRNETLQSSPPRIAQPTAGPVDLTAARQPAQQLDLTEGDDLEFIG